MSEKEYEAPRPTAYCSLDNSTEIDCDFCRRKEPITYKGVDYFCIAPIIERRYFGEMKERRRNISLTWGNNYLVEGKNDRSKHDSLDTASGLGNRMEGKEDQPLESLGTPDQAGERGSQEGYETKDVVGETFGG